VTNTPELSALIQDLCLNIELLNESTDNVNENANQSLMLSTRDKNTAKECSDSIRQMVNFIDQISLNKDDTSDITTIITNIIQKTRILSTNAKIEAARLGDQGRRFNIVAEEMNNLSSKTERVVEQIHSVLDQTIDYVTDAAAHAHIASDKLDLLETSEDLVFTFLNELTESVTQQRQQMSTFTQHTDGFLNKEIQQDEIYHLISDIIKTLSFFKTKTLTVKENTQQVHRLVDNVSESAHDCIEQLHEMIASVKQINASSTSINNLIRDIHIVTDDTILLSLNAKIEAARIGVHGGAFMVIADEMRKLVITTDTAISKIHTVLQDTIDHAALAIEMSGQSEEFIEMLEMSDQLISSLMESFAPSVNNQLKCVQQVSTSLKKYDRPSDSNPSRPSLSDQRNYIRYKLNGNATISAESNLSGTIGDISLGGLFVLTSSPPNKTWMNKHGEVSMTTTLAGSPLSIDLIAAVTFVTDKGVGLQFGEQTNESKIKLSRLIAELRTQQS